MAEKDNMISMELKVPEQLHQILERLRAELSEELLPFYIDVLRKGGAVKEIEEVLEQHITVTDSIKGQQITLFEFMEGEELYINRNLPPQFRSLGSSE